MYTSNSDIKLGRGCIYSHSYTLSNDNAVKAELTCMMKIFSKIIRLNCAYTAEFQSEQTLTHQPQMH